MTPIILSISVHDCVRRVVGIFISSVNNRCGRVEMFFRYFNFVELLIRRTGRMQCKLHFFNWIISLWWNCCVMRLRLRLDNVSHTCDEEDGIDNHEHRWFPFHCGSYLVDEIRPFPPQVQFHCVAYFVLAQQFHVLSWASVDHYLHGISHSRPRPHRYISRLKVERQLLGHAVRLIFPLQKERMQFINCISLINID